MPDRRRLVLQLTPLLDLLLIVVFAQYMDIKQRSGRTMARMRFMTDRKMAEEHDRRKRAEAERDDAQLVRDRCLREVEAKAKTIGELRKEQDDLRKVLADAEQAKEQAQQDLVKIGQLVSEVLNVPKDAMDRALKDLPAEGRKNIRKALEDLRGKGPGAIIRHLRKQEELQKRVDIWEIHIDDQDKLAVRLNSKEMGGMYRVRSSDDFRLKLARKIQSQSEPKSLVLLLLSFAGGATRQTRKDAETGVFDLCKELRSTYEGKKRFEAAVIGLIETSRPLRKGASTGMRSRSPSSEAGDSPPDPEASRRDGGT